MSRLAESVFSSSVVQFCVFFPSEDMYLFLPTCKSSENISFFPPEYLFPFELIWVYMQKLSRGFTDGTPTRLIWKYDK
jgi:hypothetical protein